MPNPKEKTILETFKDSPYKDYTLDCLATSTLSSIGYICKMLDEKYKIPEMKNGEMNPDSWVNKNLSIGSELNSQYRHMDPNASFKYVPDRRSMAMGSVYDSDVSDLDKKASQFYNDVTREYKQLCEEKKDDPEFKAFKNIFDAQMLSADYRSGDYFSALADNPYLMSFFSQSNGMPRFESLPLSELKKGLEASPSADPETKGPLGMLDEYCRCTNELIRREYDKQKLIKEGYTPEQEKEYLQNLKRDMTATVTNFNKLYKFCEEHGSKYKAGGFLNNDLDHITGVDNNHTRDVGHSVGHVQGQIRAIDNGWGMEELGPLGALGELKYRLETDYRKGDYSINNQSNMVKTALDNMEKAKAEKNDKKEKAAQADYEDHLLKRQQAIDKKQQSKDLLDDMKELDDTVLNRKVSNAAEKLEVINTILDFAEKKEKKYPETPVNALFGKELKTLISETREKVFGELQMDNAIKGLEDGQKGTLFGKKDYDKVLKDMKALNEMYKTNKNAFLNYDKTAYTPEIKAKEEEY